MNLNPLTWFRRTETAAQALERAKAERAAKVIDAEARLSEARRSHDKPKPPESTMRCAVCQYHGIAGVPGGQLRCAQCGHQWWPAGAKPPNPNPYSRAELFGRGDGALRW